MNKLTGISGKGREGRGGPASGNGRAAELPLDHGTATGRSGSTAACVPAQSGADGPGGGSGSGGGHGYIML